jgi:hypothetical protein
MNARIDKIARMAMIYDISFFSNLRCRYYPGEIGLQKSGEEAPPEGPTAGGRVDSNIGGSLLFHCNRNDFRFT